MENPTLPNGDSTRQSQIGTGSLFERKIEFHLARKPFSGVVNFDSKFKLETLNPIATNGSLAREVKSFSEQMAVERSEGVSLGRCGFDDPELSFGITFKRIGAGLENLGNTCFLNSVLQCLTYTEPLVAYLQSGRHQSSCQIAGFCALCAIQKHVSRALHATGRSLAPKDLVSNLRCISRTFRNARQEDAHEYMVQLLESMHKCCLPKGVPSESPSAYEKSLVHQIFGGRLQSQVRCMQCSYCSNKYDPFLDLSLEIAKADTLQKALGHFTSKEQLDDGAMQYQCQQCKQKVRAVKQLTVHVAPYVLTIHLKRFSAHDPRQKIDRKVAFSPKLDLKPFVSGYQEGSLMYTLYGVLVHAGWSTRSGHYYCFVRTSTGMWYSLDDNRVVQVNERTVLDQKAYMLFYVRDRKISAPKKPSNVTLNERMSSRENNLILTLTKGLKGVGQNGSSEKHVGGEHSDNATKVDIDLKMETRMEKKSGIDSSTPTKCASLKATLSNITGTPLQNGTKIALPLAKSCDNLEGSLGNGTVTSSKENILKKGTLVSADMPPSCSIVQCRENKNAAMPKNPPQAVGNGWSSGASVISDSSREDPATKVDTTVPAGIPSNLPISSKANDQKKILDCSDMLKPKKGLSKPLVVTLRLSTNVMSGRWHMKKHTQNRRSIFKHQNSSRKILENTASTSDSVSVASATSQRKEQSPLKKKFTDPVRKELHSKKTLLSRVVGECDAKTKSSNSKHAASESAKCRSSNKIQGDDGKICVNSKTNSGDSTLVASKSVKCGSSNKIRGDDAKLCVNSRAEKVSALRTGLKRGLGLDEPTVARWDGTLSASEELASMRCESTRIGYVPDEWDEEYDRGKRKKVKSLKDSYDGTNPFQELATSKAISRKTKKDQSSSANRPFRIS